MRFENIKLTTKIGEVFELEDMEAGSVQGFLMKFYGTNLVSLNETKQGQYFLVRSDSIDHIKFDMEEEQ